LNPEEITSADNEVVDTRVGKPFKALKGHSHFVSCLSMARDSKHVVSGSWGNYFI
jgi:WD40 repeat protein